MPPPEPEVPPRPETMGFGLERMSVSEADASAAVLVLRDGGRRGVSAFTWWTTDGTANAGADFAPWIGAWSDSAVGEQNRTLHVPIVGDRSQRGVRRTSTCTWWPARAATHPARPSHGSKSSSTTTT